MSGHPGRSRAAWIAAALLALTAVAYEPVRHNAFISLDDGVYITENPPVLRGLSPDSFAWAFGAGHAGNWHPLTWLSHMADVSLWGVDPAAHHAVNVVLHALSALVLFLLVRAWTGRDGAAAFTAAVFALHPLHVESVAWAAERKDVLSALLGLLTLAAYSAWRRGGRRGAYVLALVLYALGLAAKPMLVTLPALMLLLEVLVPPQGSARRAPMGAVVRSLLPFGLLALGSAAVTVHAQSVGGAVTDVQTLGLGARLANAVTSCAAYLGLFVLPRDLAIFYPYHPEGPSPGRVALAVVVVATLSVLAWRARRSHPWTAFGWAFYLVTLLPVIGLVQVGQQALADRYTYLPLVGVSLALAMRVPAGRDRTLVLPAALALGLLWTGLTRAQVALWKDDLTLFGHTLAVTERNHLALERYGQALADAGRPAEAAETFRAAIALRPRSAGPYNNLGLALEALGRHEEALARYDEALALDPGLAAAHANRGNVLDTLGRLPEAEAALRRSLELEPDAPVVLNTLGVTLARQGRSDEAVAALRSAVGLDPAYGSGWLNLALALQQAGRSQEALQALREGVRLEPGRRDAAESLRALEASQAAGDLDPTSVRPGDG